MALGLLQSVQTVRLVMWQAKFVKEYFANLGVISGDEDVLSLLRATDLML